EGALGGLLRARPVLGFALEPALQRELAELPGAGVVAEGRLAVGPLVGERRALDELRGLLQLLERGRAVVVVAQGGGLADQRGGAVEGLLLGSGRRRIGPRRRREDHGDQRGRGA